jgi:hypothetical protein
VSIGQKNFTSKAKAHNLAQKYREAKSSPFDLVLHGGKKKYFQKFSPLPPTPKKFEGGVIFFLKIPAYIVIVN